MPTGTLPRPPGAKRAPPPTFACNGIPITIRTVSHSNGGPFSSAFAARFLKAYAADWIVEITDLSPFVAEQRRALPEDPRRLITPEERVCVPRQEIAARIGL